MPMYHVFSHRLLNALLRGCPALCRHLHCDSDKAFHARQVVCAVISWGLSYCSFTPPGSLEMTEGRAAPRVAGQETLPPDGRMDVTCSFGGNHYCNLYIRYNHEQVHDYTIMDVWTSIHSLEIWALSLSSVSAGPRIDCYGCAGKSSSGLLLPQCVCLCVPRSNLRHMSVGIGGVSCCAFFLFSELEVPNKLLTHQIRQREKKDWICGKYYIR